MRFHQGYYFHCAGVSCAFLTLNCSACIFIDIISLDIKKAVNQESLVKLSRHSLNLGHTLEGAELTYDIATKVFEAKCNLPPKQLCAPSPPLGTFCVPNPFYHACTAGYSIFLWFSYAILIAVKIAHQAVDQAYDLASLGDHMCCLMSHISITNQTSCQFKYFLYHM